MNERQAGEKMSGDDFMTKLIFVFVLALSIVTELLVAIIIWKHPNPQFPTWLVNILTVCIVASIPAVASVRGYLIVKKLRLGENEPPLTRTTLSRLFLGGVAGAYMILILMIAILS